MTAGGLTPHLLTTMSTVKASPKWSFPGRREHQDHKMTPGPGAYMSVAPEASTMAVYSPKVGGWLWGAGAGRHLLSVVLVTTSEI